MQTLFSKNECRHGTARSKLWPLLLPIVLQAFVCDARVLHSTTATTTTKHPIILIPGDGGSRAYVQPSDRPLDQPELLWLNLQLLLRPDYMVDRFKLLFDPLTNQTHDPTEFNVTFPGWGETWSVSDLSPSATIFGSYYDKMVGYFEHQDAFFKSNTTIRGVPYDFRRGNGDDPTLVPRLKQLVEATYELANQTSVVIVSHSLGGIVANYFFDNQSPEWLAKYIHAPVYLSVPWGGSVKALLPALSNGPLGLFFIPPLVLRPVYRSEPSLGQIIPSPLLWESDEVLVETGTRNYTIADYESLFRDANASSVYTNFLIQSERFNSTIRPKHLGQMHCLYGTKLSTPVKLVYPSNSSKDFPDSVPYLKVGSGDGTVNDRSLQVCDRWHDTQVTRLPFVDHSGMMDDARVFEYIGKVAGIDYKDGN